MSQLAISRMDPPSKPLHGRVIVLVVIILLLVGFIALIYSTRSTPQATSLVTQQLYQTSVQEIFSTQTLTVRTNPTISAVSIPSVTPSSAVPAYANNPPPYLEYQTCQYNCLYPTSGYSSLCQPTGGNNTVQCSGYIYHDTSGCVELAIPFVDPYYLDSVAYQYYTLHDLPSYQFSGWVTVTGQLYQGFNLSPSGSVCPLNYINVSTVY